MLSALAHTAQAPAARKQTTQRLASNAAALAALANATAGAPLGSPAATPAATPSEEEAITMLPSALERPTLVTIAKRIARCWTPAFCLDYDGTLAPLVADPAAARLPPGTRALLRQIADRHPTAIVSGRSMEKLRAWVDVRSPPRPSNAWHAISGDSVLICVLSRENPPGRCQGCTLLARTASRSSGRMARSSTTPSRTSCCRAYRRHAARHRTTEWQGTRRSVRSGPSRADAGACKPTNVAARR